MAKKPDGYIELKFGPRWRYIAPARGFIQSFVAIAIEDQNKADGIAMAASELLENAVKYSAGEETIIIVQAYPDQNLISCSVTNQGTAESAKELQGLYKRIMSGDALEAYISQMREAAVRQDGKSQLGLARIRYEVGANIKLEVSPDYKITITIEVH